MNKNQRHRRMKAKRRLRALARGAEMFLSWKYGGLTHLREFFRIIPKIPRGLR